MTTLLTRCTTKRDCPEAVNLHDLHFEALTDGDPEQIEATYKAWRRHRNLCIRGKR